MNPPAERRRVWAAIAAATAVNLPFGSLYAFSVFLKPMETMLGTSRAELSFVFGLASVFFTVGMLIAPYLFGYASATVLLLGCAIAGTGGVILAATTNGIVQLAIGYGVLFGLGGGVAYILVQQGVNLMVTTRKGLVNGYIVSLYPAGAMIATPAFGWGIAHFGLRETLGGLAAALTITGIITIALVRYAGVKLAPPPGTVAPKIDPRWSIFWKLLAVFFLAAAAGLTVLSQSAGIIAAYGGTTALALIATTYITAFIAAARLIGGWLTDRFSIPTIMAGAHVFALMGDIVLTLWPGPVSAAISLTMIGMGYGFISGSAAAAVVAYWNAAVYGRIASRLYIGWCVAALSLPVVAGRLFDLTGGYQTTVLVAGAGNILGILIALTLPRQAR